MHNSQFPGRGEPIQKLRTFLSVVEAEQARNRLAAAGIECLLEGAELQTTLSYIGSAIGGVSLFVAAENTEEANTLLDSSDPSYVRHPWICGQCFEQVDEGFEICWNCGADFANRWIPTEDSPESNFANPNNLSIQLEPNENPFAPPARYASPSEIEARRESIQDPDIRRAYNAAILGGVLLIPVLANVYSLFLLMLIWPRYPQLSAQDQSRFAWAAGINLLSLLAVAMLVWGTTN